MSGPGVVVSWSGRGGDVVLGTLLTGLHSALGSLSSPQGGRGAAFLQSARPQISSHQDTENTSHSEPSAKRMVERADAADKGSLQGPQTASTGSHWKGKLAWEGLPCTVLLTSWQKLRLQAQFSHHQNHKVLWHSTLGRARVRTWAPW